MADLSIPLDAPTPSVTARVADEGALLRDELRVAAMVWQRELIRFSRAKARVVSGLAQPVMFLFVLGFGLTPLVGDTAGFDFKKFVLPGVVAMSVVTSAIFSGISIVWDREFGFLREMLVAPASRASLVLGKIAGGATVATLQGVVMLALAPFVGVQLTPVLVGQVFAVQLLMAAALTAFGVFVASRIQRMESFQVVMQLLLMPMLFLSGAMFPLDGLPGWLTVLTRINPLTYAVDPLRRLVFQAQDVPAVALERFSTGVELFGHRLSIAAELGIVVVFAVVFTAAAVQGFRKAE